MNFLFGTYVRFTDGPRYWGHLPPHLGFTHVTSVLGMRQRWRVAAPVPDLGGLIPTLPPQLAHLPLEPAVRP